MIKNISEACLLFFLGLIFGFYFLLEAKGGSMASQEERSEIIKKLSSFLPVEIGGWRAKDEAELYDPESIFSYINGAGEVYRSYGFRWLLVRRFERENFPLITVDFFVMGRSEDAFGVFTHDLEGEPVSIGQDGLYKSGWLAFWKDRFYVSIYAEQETDEVKKAIMALGQAISQVIPEEGNRPALLDLLPSSWDKKKAHYLHIWPILNYHFFVAAENWLDLDETTEAVLAWVQQESQKKIHLLIISYPDPARAQQAIKKFFEFYLPEADESGLARTEDGFWTGAKSEEQIVAIVFGAKSSEEAESILSQVFLKAKEIAFSQESK